MEGDLILSRLASNANTSDHLLSCTGATSLYVQRKPSEAKQQPNSSFTCVLTSPIQPSMVTKVTYL
jgi:hypothetical protein